MKSIIIFTFMIKDLHLKGAELLIYALIYSFSQFGQVCYMKADTMAQELGLSRSQVFRCLSSLLKKDLITYNGSAYLTYTRDFYDMEAADDLERMIKIAKTPWLD